MPTELLANVNGAIGSDLSASRNRVWFVEYSGRISRVDLVRGLAGVVSAGTGTLQGTWTFDFDVGGQVGAPDTTPPTADIWWEQVTASERRLTPLNGARIAWLGPVAFASVSHADLQQLTYDATPIDGSVGSSNRLEVGTVFAVRTVSGHYAKVQVVSYGYNLGLQWRTYALDDVYAVVGTGYTEPEDIVVSADGAHAYVTERGGSLLRVDLANANRASASVITTGMTAPHQIVLDEARGVAYVVEFAASGRLLRIDLTTGTLTTLYSGLEHGIGLAMSADAKVAWVTEQTTGGRLVRVDLVAARKEVIVGGLGAPFFLEWANLERSSVLVVDRDPNNRALMIDLNTAAPTARVVLSGLPHRPSSVVIVGGRAVVCSDAQVVSTELGASWTSTDPLFLGIGHVPASAISNTGYATTDPDYFFHVSEAPFGGTLALQLNHERAFAEGARYYRIFVDGVAQETPFNDYVWSSAVNSFVLRRTEPNAGGYFPVRTATLLWYNHWLGYQLDTTGLVDGLHALTIRFYSSASAGSELVSLAKNLRIDNTWPLVSLDAIEHQLADDSWESVGRCAIVDQPKNAFRFRITARDPEQHLLSWALDVNWGNNESARIASDTYVPGTTAWEGPNLQLVPPSGSWAAIETRCAHTFRLHAWDRVINGWSHIHRQEYSKSITLFLS